jgi:hypothetical protein
MAAGGVALSWGGERGEVAGRVDTTGEEGVACVGDEAGKVPKSEGVEDGCCCCGCCGCGGVKQKGRGVGAVEGVGVAEGGVDWWGL